MDDLGARYYTEQTVHACVENLEDILWYHSSKQQQVLSKMSLLMLLRTYLIKI